MNLKSKVMVRLHSLFRITEPQSWSRVTAAEILNVPNVGKSTLNKLRLYLAHRGISLRGDNPPAYWLDTLNRVGESGEEIRGVCPFTVIIDTNETYPFPFDQIYDSDKNLVSIRTVRQPLYQMGLADYTIQGMEEEIQIERKAEDLATSLSERRESFEQEISRLNGMCEFAAVVCEHPWRDILSDEHQHGARAKSISRTVQAWMIKYPGVHWIMCDGRYHAEQLTYRLLERFWWSKMFDRAESGNLWAEV